MSERERLISILEKARTEAGDTIGSMNGGMAAWYADKLLEAGVTLNQWIPVTERLPEEGGNYLCLENGDVRIVFFDEFEQAFGYDRTVVDPEILGWVESEFIPYNVTHWMPLPEPPKEVHNAKENSV